ncbi:MAG: SMC family ATPase [Chloroflexi bacterium]|nr:SMC family ATPase [Chloroflexota bacterium]
MIPLRLFLKNFMCYKDNVPPLDMTGLHLACLCGENGAGKSALLDAITWALWGESRAKSDDELIHLGRKDMEVELEFQASGNRYRVVRKRSSGSAGRAGHTVLELHLAMENGFRPITGNSVRETQHKIVQILRMDYQTFINSAFLRQGRFDEFTIKPPSERKAILGEILGLSLYDSLEEQAKALVREKSEESISLDSAIKEMERELAHKGEYEAELNEVKRALELIEIEVLRREAELKPLVESRLLLDQKKRQLEEVERNIKRNERELEQLRGDVEKQQRKVSEYEGILKEGPAISKSYLSLQEAREANEDLNNRLATDRELSQRKARLERIIDEARGKIQIRVSVLEDQIKRLESKINALPKSMEDLERSRGELEKMKEAERQLAQKKEQLQGFRDRLSTLRAESVQLEREIQEIKDKIELLGRAEARCPLCDAELTEEHRDEIRREYEASLQEKHRNHTRIGADMSSLQRGWNGLSRDIAQGEAHLTGERNTKQKTVAVLEREVEDAGRAQMEVGEVRQSLFLLQEQLEKENYALSERKELEGLLQELSALKYSPEEHEMIRQQVKDLEGYEGQYRRFQEAERLLPDAISALQQTQVRLTDRQRNMEEDSERCNVLQLELKALPEIEENINSLEESLNRLKHNRYESGQRLGAAQQKLDHCARLEGEKQAKDKALHQAQRERGIYEELAEAFGKKGIQSLIIEQAVPELEVEANKLLSRMTDNRMHVKIETLRETKKGETVETLDIRIADELGTRSYELYSGGEAFRINLALRIALSRLLARRAGAPLPTLFIDEGFGTQDSFGREKILDAVNSIKDDFERIIVITHIEELKEAFPVRIEVSKTENGSVMRVT